MNRLISQLLSKHIFPSRPYSVRLTADGKEIPKVKKTVQRITLISPDNTVSITDLLSAQNVSSRRDLKLVKIQDEDAKTRRPVYKLMTNAEYHVEDLEQRKEKKKARQNNATKGEKLITISSKVALNDLLTSANKMLKLLDRQFEVRVIITGEDSAKSEEIYSVLEKNTKGYGNVVQKRNKGSSLRFQLLPARRSSSDGAPPSQPASESPNKSSSEPSNKSSSQPPSEPSNKGPL